MPHKHFSKIFTIRYQNRKIHLWCPRWISTPFRLITYWLYIYCHVSLYIFFVNYILFAVYLSIKWTTNVNTKINNRKSSKKKLKMCATDSERNFSLLLLLLLQLLSLCLHRLGLYTYTDTDTEIYYPVTPSDHPRMWLANQVLYDIFNKKQWNVSQLHCVDFPIGISERSSVHPSNHINDKSDSIRRFFSTITHILSAI